MKNKKGETKDQYVIARVTKSEKVGLVRKSRGNLSDYIREKLGLK
jgi:hypothetical protein